MKSVMFFFLLFLTISMSAQNLIKDNVAETKNIQDTLVIKKWLSKVIIDYLNSKDLKTDFDKMRTALTDSYYNYKQNAINLEYGDELTEAEFQKKWNGIYDTKLVGKGGFFISAQDHGNIDIQDCKLIKTLSDNAQIYHVVIRDLRWKTNFERDIKIVFKQNRPLIDDIKEYE